jgi:hypothetical protein
MSKCRIASIELDDAMILGRVANPDGSNFRKGHLVALFESVSGPFCCGGFEPSGLGEQFYTDVLKY